MTNYKTANLTVFKQSSSPVASCGKNGVSTKFHQRWKSWKGQLGVNTFMPETVINLNFRIKDTQNGMMATLVSPSIIAL